jgi:hypothetical protein
MTDSSSGADADDSNTTPCQFCGGEYKARGVAAHERACDENPENQSGATDPQSGQTAPKSGATQSSETPLEARALERDGRCRRCGATGDPDVVDWSGDAELTVEPLVPDGTAEELQDLISLCPQCADLIDDGLHYLTKRTKVFFEGPDTS